MKTLLLLFLLLISYSKVDTQPQGIDFSKIPMEKALILNYIPNGGGIGTTDWINATNGLAQFWGKDYKNILFPSKCEVLKGNGFEGNYQEIMNQSQFMLYSCSLGFPTGQYILSLTYKSTCEVTICIRINGTCGYPLAKLHPTREVTHVSFPISTNIMQIVFYNDPFGGKACFDSINLKEL